MKKHLILFSLLMVTAFSSAWAYDFEDDIYYDPSKAKKTATKKASSSYIKDFDMQDVDSYNRRGQYYVSPVDTIGEYVSQGEDFVYTQKIQKFYNPTIVIDNATLLDDVLANSYGNVEVVYNIDGPVFSSYYNPWWGWSTSYNFWGPSWSFNWGPAWSYGWGPSWSFNWGPAWVNTWGPSWSYGWGPAWSYGWGGPWGGYYRPHYHRPYYAQWTPGRNSVNRPGSYYGAYANGGYRGGYNYNGHHGVRPSYSHAGRPGSSVTRPGSSIAGSTTRPSGHSIGGNRGVTRPGAGSSAVTGSSRPTTTTRPSTSTTRPGSSVSTTTRPGSSVSTTTRPSTSTSKGRGSSNRGSSSSSYTRPSSSSSSSSSYSRPSSSSSGRGSSAGRGSSSGSRGGSAGGRGGRR